LLLRTRFGEQLVNNMGNTPNISPESKFEIRLARRIEARREHRDWRAQFMGSIRREKSLSSRSDIKPFERLIDRSNERHRLSWDDRAGPGCLDSSPRILSGFPAGFAECGASRFCRGAGRA